ncbi:MAG: glycosyltransferase [Candidatus Sericytochromatia bacterium]
MKISMYWQGELSLYECACMSSFVRQGFALDVYSYMQELDLPAGARLCDARELLDERLSTAYTQGDEKGSPTAFSNLVRYHLISEIGGIWMDTDMFCLKPAADYAALLEDNPGKLIVASETDDKINGAVMMSRDPHPLARAMLAEARSKDVHIKEWGTLGPLLITQIALAHPEQMKILPSASFYPIYYQEFVMMLLPQHAEASRLRCRDSYGMHLWNQIYREFCIPKNLLPPEGSHLHELLAGLLPDTYPCLPLNTLFRLLEGHRALHQIQQISQVLSS